jgi:hypothetical protein
MVPYGTLHYNRKGITIFAQKLKKTLNQVFVPYIKTLPREAPKILIGDNLAAHLSPYVIMMCRLHNVRYVLYRYGLGTIPNISRVPPGTVLYRTSNPSTVRNQLRKLNLVSLTSSLYYFFKYFFCLRRVLVRHKMEAMVV